jgi:hypothetical protein
MKNTNIFILASLFIMFTRCIYAGELHVLQQRDISIHFEAQLDSAAKEVADIYPEIKATVEGIFGWSLNRSPSVILIKDRQHFQRMTGNPLTVAFAVPERNLIVIDYSRMSMHPFSPENTLKHELCHLLLHDHIGKHLLPRWLDEGVCQWVSDGIADIIMDQKQSHLNKAAVRNTFCPLSSLQKGFPPDKRSMLLAYEESKSFVAHIISRFGKEGILNVLEHMKKGETVDMAILRTFSISLDNLEEEWQHSLRTKMNWFTHLSFYLYEILFSLMAFISICAFVKIMLKKRAYMMEETDDNRLSQ